LAGYYSLAIDSTSVGLESLCVHVSLWEHLFM